MFVCLACLSCRADHVLFRSPERRALYGDFGALVAIGLANCYTEAGRAKEVMKRLHCLKIKCISRLFGLCRPRSGLALPAEPVPL